MTARHLEQRTAWARAHLTAAQALGPIPRYGTPAWHALPAADPRRWAAVITAAEAWATDDDPAVLAARLRHELAAEQDAATAREDQAFAAAAARIRGHANSPTYAELQQRRGIAS